MVANVISDLSMEWLGEEFIDFLDEFLDLWNEFNKSFRDKNDTIVLAQVSSLTD